MIIDTRRETLGTRQKVVEIEGCYVRPRFDAVTASDIAVVVEGGVAVVADKVQQIASQELAVRVGDTLAASSEGYTAVVAYYNSDVDGTFILAVDGTEALTSAGAVEVTDAEIAAALPNEDFDYTVLAMVKSSTDGSSVVTVAIDHRARSYGVPTSGKNTAAAYHEDHLANGGAYKPWGTLSHVVDAADIANGDLLTNRPLPLIHGRLARMRFVAEKAITTGAKTADINLEIGTANVTGTTTYAGTKALGTVTAGTALSAGNTFKPGDTYSIEAAAVTSFVEGRVRIEVDVDELVLGSS